MKKRMVKAITATTLLASFALLGLGACAHEGPMERTGRHVDNAAKDVKHDLKND